VLIPDKACRILDSVVRLKNQLSDIIQPDFGLLDELLFLGVLTRRQYTKVRSGDKTVYEQNDMMLDLLTSEEQYEKFLIALRRTQQQHIINFIKQTGGQKTMICVIHVINNWRYRVMYY